MSSAACSQQLLFYSTAAAAAIFGNVLLLQMFHQVESSLCDTQHVVAALRVGGVELENTRRLRARASNRNIPRPARLARAMMRLRANHAGLADSPRGIQVEFGRVSQLKAA